MDLKADKKSLKLLLGMEDQQFRIPPYQRPYSWSSEQIDDLWEDLLEHASTGHFMGSIVMSTENDMRPLVIDGQQRLTTLMLLMAVLRDECYARGLQKQVARIDKRLIADDLAEGDDYFKFKTGSANWPVFRDFILRAPADPKRRETAEFAQLGHELRARNTALVDNLARLRRLVTEHLSSLSQEQQREWLTSFDKALMEKVELVVIEVRDLADAFLLFETLNDRGMQLSAADLLKSHLLGRIAKHASDEEVEEAAASWDDMLERLGRHVDVSRFLRHYLLGSLQSVRKDEVFGAFKTLVDKQDALSVLTDIRKAAELYGEFENPGMLSHEPTQRVLMDLQTLRATVCYVALLPARRYLSEEDFVDFARLAEILTYRYSSIAGLGTNDLERRYRDAAHLLNKSKGADLDKARAVLIGTMPDVKTFTLAFENMRMGTQYLLRYTLQKIEERVAPSVEKKIKANNLVHIEHVMPQKLSDDWKKTLGNQVELHDEYINRWGNLTLLYWKLNIPASNNGFTVKKGHYQESEVAITKSLLEWDAWGPEQIDERQTSLARIADEVWAIPPQTNAPAAMPSHAVDMFRAELGDRWSALEEFCVEATPEDVQRLADQVDGHLQGTSRGAEAAEIAQRLRALIARWAALDGGQRSVLNAAIGYFLEFNDQAHDESVGGLDDDQRVVTAAESALSR